jgi:hypothetical protein
MNIKKITINLYCRVLKVLGYDFIYFIHIGKTAGSAIRNSFAEKSSFTKKLVKSDNKLLLLGYGHNFRFNDLDDNEFCFFVVRDPISRFISGFYSRLREGKPKNFNPWKPDELKAFKIFKTPNQIAEALSSSDLNMKKNAEEAMLGIGHVNSSYWDWFISSEYLIKNKFKILTILMQEDLSSDFKKFTAEHNLNIKLPKDEIKSHKMPDQYDKKLSGLAILNLKNWFEKDYQFLNILYNQKLISKRYE